MNENERSALAAYRTSLGAKQPQPGRDWSRLVDKIEAGTQPLPMELDPPRRRRWVAWSLGAAAAVLLALWAWPRFEAAQGEDAAGASQAAYGSGERASLVLEPRPEPSVRVVLESRGPMPESEAPEFQQDEVDPAPVPDEAPKHSAPPTEPASKRTRSQAAVKPTRDAPEAQDVVAEAKALREIRASLRDQHANRSLELLRRYLARFPSGVFRDEATLLRADALCLAGQRDKARAVGAAFVRTHPKSPLTARARSVCQES